MEYFRFILLKKKNPKAHVKMDLLEKYDPTFKHINDTIAFATHLAFLQRNCQLIGLNENQFLDDLGSVPQKWNENHEIYQFRYIPKENINDKNKESKTILVKILSVSDDELMISVLPPNSENVFTLDVNINDHIDVENFKKDQKKTKLHYKNLDGLLSLISENITKKAINEPKKEEEKEEKPKKNPLLIDDDDNPYMNPNIGFNRGGQRPLPDPYGDFGRDLDPFGGFGDIGGGGGGLMGPQHPKFQPQNFDPNKPNNIKPNARFDPWGPGLLGKKKGPDPDHMPPPNGGSGMFI